MPNLAETVEELRQFLTARVPVVILRSQERGRALQAIHSVAAALPQLPFFVHSSAEGLYQLGRGGSAMSDDH